MQEPIKVTQIYTDTSEIPKLFTYAQDKKKRKRISLFLVLAMLLSIAIPSSPLTSPTPASAAISSISDEVCPYPGGTVESLGWAGCTYCGGSEIDWGSINGHSGNNIKIGTGYQDKYLNETNEYIYYERYRCENCGDTGSYDCKKYTDKIGIVKINKKTGAETLDTTGSASKGPGQVPIRQCSTCGPILHGSGSSCATTCYSEAKWAVPHVKPVKITASASPSTAGVASASAYNAKSGVDSVTVNAEAYEGHLFSYWEKNGSNVGGGDSYTFTPEEDTTMVAHFITCTPTPTPPPVPPGTNISPSPPSSPSSTFVITTSTSPANGGTLSGDGNYKEGEKVTIEAKANTGYKLDKIEVYKNGSSKVSSTVKASKFITTVKEDVKYVAIFKSTSPLTTSAPMPTSSATTKYTLYLSASPYSGGNTYGDGSYAPGEVVTFRAAPNPGYKFTGWSDGVYANSRTITMGNTNLYYTAYFEAVKSDITIDYNGGADKDGRTSYVFTDVGYKSTKGKNLKNEVPNYNTIAKTGYHLLNWKASSGYGSATVYDAEGLHNSLGTSFRSASGENLFYSDYTVYANWKENEYNVILHSNTAENETKTMKCKYDKEYYLSNSFYFAPTIIYDVNTSDENAKVFRASPEIINATTSGWAKSKTGETLYPISSPVKNLTAENNGAVHLYAKWENCETQLPYAIRTGYNFLGWKTSAVDSPVYPPGSTFAPNGDTTLYAVWQEIAITITYDANGGTAPSFTSKRSSYGVPYGDFPLTSRVGYTQGDWYYIENETIRPVTRNTKIATMYNHTLYAFWNPKSYDLRLSPNGGLLNHSTNIQTVGKYEYGSENLYSLQGLNAEREGYSLLGWYTSPSGGTKVYDKDGLYVSPALDLFDDAGKYKRVLPQSETSITLYAQWEIKKIKVTLDPVGGTFPAGTPTEIVINYGETYPNLPIPVLQGYKFKDWVFRSGTNDAISETIVKPGSLTKSNEDHVLYATWELKTIIVNYDYNFNYKNNTDVGSANVSTKGFGSSTSITYGDSYGVLPEPERVGYTFKGWFPSESNNNGTGVQITKETPMLKEDTHTLYAQWDDNEYVLTYIYNYPQHQ